MAISDSIPPESIRFEHYDQLLAACPTVQHLSTAIHQGLMRTLSIHDPAFGRRHELVFLFRDGQARDNEQALRRWVEEWVNKAVAMGVADDDILGYVGDRFFAEMADAGWR